MKKHTSTLVLCFFSAICAFSQVEKKSVVIGKLISKPNAILILNPADDNQGFLLPQLTTTNRLSIIPSSPAEDGLMVFDITEKLFYHWKNNQWVNGLGTGVNQTLIYDPTNNTISLSDGNTISLTGVPAGMAGGDLTGNYPNPDIANSAITSAKILDGTITSADILDLTIANTDLANNAITTLKITDGAVTNLKLANTTVTPGSYGTGTQVSQFVVDAQGRITSANNVTLTGVAPTGVAGGDLTGTYPNPDIAIGAITSAKILDGTITSADILDLTIANADLTNNAVTTLKITDGAVTNLKLANTTVTPGSYGTGTQVSQFVVDAQGRITSANNVTLTGVAPTGVAGGDLTGTYPNPDVANSAITSAKILDGTITSADILDLTIANADLTNNAVTTLKITDGAVTNLKLANTTVTPGSYGTGTQVSQFVVDAQGRITSANNVTLTGVAPTGVAGGDLSGTYPNPDVANSAITSAKILDGTITSADILDLTIASADLANNAVTTLKITDGAITNVKLANTTVTPNTYGTALAVPQFTVDAQGRITGVTNIAITGVLPGGVAGGDLTGTYPNPIVSNNAITSAKILDGTISSADILDATITPLDLATNAVTTIKILDGAVTNLKLANTTVTPGSYGNGTQVSQLVVDAQGRITSASNIAITGAAPTGAAGGDLTGIYPNPTVGNNAITSAKILDGTVSGVDILDGTIATVDLASNSVTSLKILDGAVTNLKLANTTVTPGSYGAGTQVSQFVVDAQGRITSASNIAITGAAPTGAAGGALAGSYPNPTVALTAGDNLVTSINSAATSIRVNTNRLATSVVLDSESPSAGNISGDFNSGLLVNPSAITTTEIADGTISTIDLANLAVTNAKIASGLVVSKLIASGTNGDVMTTIGGVTAWAAAPLPSGVASGDLAGPYPNPTVAKLRGNAVNNTTLTVGDNGKALVWDGTQWIATVVPGITLQTSYYSVDPSDFALVREDNSDNHGAVIFDAEHTFVTADGDNKGEFIMAPLHFPHGAILNQMIIYYGDNSPNSITVSLLRKNLATSVSNVMNTWTSSVNTGGILTQTTVSFNGFEVIGNDIYSYRLYVNFDFNSNVDNPGDAIQRIYGVRIRYQH